MDIPLCAEVATTHQERDPLDERILQVGLGLYTRVRQRRPWPFSRAWLDDRIMSWMIRNDAVKVQLFRFIDALPSLTSDGHMVRLLREYLGPVHQRLPWGVRHILHDPTRPATALLACCARLMARMLAVKFIAASTVPQAVAVVRRLRRQGLGFTIDVLGESVLTDHEANRYRDTYLRLIDHLADPTRPWSVGSPSDESPPSAPHVVSVSIKLSALTPCFDPTAVERTRIVVSARLRPLLRHARDRGVFVTIDMEHHAVKDLILSIFCSVLNEIEFREWPHVGIAMQAYLLSCGDDLARLLQWSKQRGTPVSVRLVKGAYHDYECVVASQYGWPLPVFRNKSDTDANFELQTRFLLAHHIHLRPAFASHNIRSIAHALAHADAMRVPRMRYEFQMLYGMAEPVQASLIDLGHNVRIYTPFGQSLPGMAYLVRRLLENTSNQSFVRSSLLDDTPPENLLMDPLLATSTTHDPVPIPAFINEPLADFSRASVRQEVMEAIASVAEQSTNGIIPLVIDGQPVVTDNDLVSLNPSHRRRTVGRVACAHLPEVERAITAATKQFPAWSAQTVRFRSSILLRTAEILRRRRCELCAWIILEAGKSMIEADAEVAEAIDFCTYYAADMERLDRGQSRNVPGETNQVRHIPRGVAVVISPWNFPLAILCGMTAAALVTGNTVIMKPAEQTPVIAAKLMDIFTDTGVPAGVLNFVPGIGDEIGKALVAHRGVSIIAFTGSMRVGLDIQRLAAHAAGRDASRTVKRVICEMGGKNAIIVDDDADLDDAVAGVMQSAFAFQGQKCSACSRVIVLDSIHDVFLERLVAATKCLGMGPAEEPGLLGPIIDTVALAHIRAHIDQAATESRLAFAADPGDLHDEGFYIGPHIFADVAPDSRLAQDEIFGPVLAVIRASDLSQALAIANGTRYALTGGLYSRSPAHIARVKAELDVGNCYINRKITGALVDRQPFGGYRLSGIGSKAGGPEYLQQFLHSRCITENTLRHGFTPDESHPSC